MIAGGAINLGGCCDSSATLNVNTATFTSGGNFVLGCCSGSLGYATFNASTISVGNDGGFYISGDKGKTWKFAIPFGKAWWSWKLIGTLCC